MAGHVGMSSCGPPLVYYRVTLWGLLFALGLQGPLEDIVRDIPEVRVVAYFDDVYIRGPQGEVAQAFRRLCERCEAIGLVMATQKCEVWSRVLQGTRKVLGFSNTRVIQSLGGPNGKVNMCWDSQRLCLSILGLRKLDHCAWK
jgi:hypothetical protein